MTDREVIAASLGRTSGVQGDLGRGWQLGVLALLLGVFVALGWSARAKIELRSGDELAYLSLSHSIEQGGYREVYRPSAPRHVKYPPVYPAWLVVARAAVGQRIELLPLVNLLLVATAFTVFFLIAQRLPVEWQGGWLALAMLLPLCVNRGLVRMAGSYYSEALFILLCTLTLAATFLADKGERRWSYVAIVLCAATFLTRMAGIAMVAAVGLWLVLGTRRYREWLFFGMVSLLSVGGWFAYVWRVQAVEPAVRSYAYDLGLNALRVPAEDRLGIIERAWTALHQYGLYAVPIDMSLRYGGEPTLPTLYKLLAFYIGVPVGLWFLWKRWRAAALFVVCYVGVLLAFPYLDPRLVVPALPLLVLASLVGMWALTSRLSGAARAVVRVAYVAFLVALGSRASWHLVERYAGCDRAKPYDSAACYDPPARDLIAAGRYLAANTSGDTPAMAWRATSVAFISNRLIESPLILTEAPPQQFGALMRRKGIRHVLLTTMNDFETRELTEALIASCVDFTLVMKLPAGSLLFATRDAPDATVNACQAIAVFRSLHPYG